LIIDGPTVCDTTHAFHELKTERRRWQFVELGNAISKNAECGDSRGHGAGDPAIDCAVSRNQGAPPFPAEVIAAIASGTFAELKNFEWCENYSRCCLVREKIRNLIDPKKALRETLPSFKDFEERVLSGLDSFHEHQAQSLSSWLWKYRLSRDPLKGLEMFPHELLTVRLLL
jgi:hypothetical protein